MKKILVMLCLFIALSAVLFAAKVVALKAGFWKVLLQRPDGKEIVFNFQTKDSAKRKIIYVLNGDEKLLVDNIKVKGDSVFIQMPFFESSFKAKIGPSGNLTGVWLKNLGDRNQSMPCIALYNHKERFVTNTPPKYNITGRWAVHFRNASGSVPSVGEFVQEGSLVKGTFLTPTGDYRYLEGVVTGDTLQLSTFDGGHAFLFTARLQNSIELSEGRYYSGPSGMETWTAIKDPQAKLPDGYDATHVRKGEDVLNFRFKSIDGSMVSINDATYRNKVVIVQLMGSWCPNCMDETAFLSRYYDQNKKRGVEVIALAYERTESFEKSRQSLEHFRARFKVHYPMLVTGVTLNDTYKTEKTLPQLDEIKGFPTSIFIDKKGKVRKIYTGFEGPGTGLHYKEFQNDFNTTVNELLSE